MKFTLPYLTTRIETDLFLTFLLTPLWWITGFSVFIYHAAVLWIFLKFLLGIIQNQQQIRCPKPLVWFFVFLMAYLGSILINIPVRPPQRIFASLNNWIMMMMGLLIFLISYNCEPRLYFDKLLRASSAFCFLTGILGIGVIILWFQGTKDIKMATFLGKLFPSLLNYPFFANLLTITGTMPDYLFKHFDKWPRLTIYSMAPTATGGFMLMILPLARAYYRRNPVRMFEGIVVLAMGLTVLFFSLSRSALYAFVNAIVLVYVIRKGFSFILALVSLLAGIVGSGLFAKFLEWMLNLRVNSNVGRFNMYQDALKILFDENPLVGLGVKLRDDFNFAAVGTHGGIYLEVIFTAGIIGLFFFLLFQFSMGSQWVIDRFSPQSLERKELWKYLGVSMIGVNLWLFTDTLTAYPLITYTYFLICGAIVLLKRLPEETPKS
jgi:O-antigen ligase